MTPQERPEPGRTRREGNITYIQTEFATRVRSAVKARSTRSGEAQAAGGRPQAHSRTLSEINRLANAYLKAHTAELLAQAEASRTVQMLTNSFRQKLVDLEAKSLIENPVQNGGAK